MGGSRNGCVGAVISGYSSDQLQITITVGVVALGDQIAPEPVYAYLFFYAMRSMEEHPVKPGSGLHQKRLHCLQQIREQRLLLLLPVALLRNTNRLPTWQKLRALDIGKIFEALGYGAEINPLVVLLGLSLTDLRSEPFGPSCEGLPVLALERGEA